MFGPKYAPQRVFNITTLCYTALALQGMNNEARGEPAGVDLRGFLEPGNVGSPKDDLWRGQILKAAQDTADILEDRLRAIAQKNDKYTFSAENVETMAKVLQRIASDSNPDGTPSKTKGALFTKSHPTPGDRVTIYRNELNLYLMLAVRANWLGVSFR